MFLQYVLVSLLVQIARPRCAHVRMYSVEQGLL
jgi:hypothetical protein